MKRRNERRARSGRIANASDHHKELNRRDQERQAKIAHVQAMVDEGLASGDGSHAMEELKRIARRRYGS